MTKVTIVRRGCTILFASICSLASPPSCLAQTQDIQEGGGLNGIGDARAKTVLMNVLQKSVDVEALGKGRTLKEVCGELYQVLAKNGDILPILVDADAFAAEHPNGGDIFDAPVALPRVRGPMTIAAILNYLVDHLPGGNGVLCLAGSNPNYVQITTKKALANEATAVRLADKVDMSDFKKQMPLREALGKLGIRMVLEHDAFKSGPVVGDCVLDVMVGFP
ncbi:MAG TPA: hypothetical protein VE988_02475, partial [Gemmataceae bacterium]|nr:hypothetical protein [Gemmataceae bacterium]